MPYVCKIFPKFFSWEFYVIVAHIWVDASTFQPTHQLNHIFTNTWNFHISIPCHLVSDSLIYMKSLNSNINHTYRRTYQVTYIPTYIHWSLYAYTPICIYEDAYIYASAHLHLFIYRLTTSGSLLTSLWLNGSTKIPIEVERYNNISRFQ